MQRHMAKDEAIFKIPVSDHEHEFSLFFLFSNIEDFQWCLLIQNNPFLLQGTELYSCHNAPAGFADRAGVSVRVVVGHTASSVLGGEERNSTP